MSSVISIDEIDYIFPSIEWARKFHPKDTRFVKPDPVDEYPTLQWEDHFPFISQICVFGEGFFVKRGKKVEFNVPMTFYRGADYFIEKGNVSWYKPHQGPWQIPAFQVSGNHNVSSMLIGMSLSGGGMIEAITTVNQGVGTWGFQKLHRSNVVSEFKGTIIFK